MAEIQSINLLKSALDNGRIDVLRSLLNEIGLRSKKEFSEIVDPPCINGGTFLHYATEKADIDALRTLLSSGANPCVQNDDGKTPYQLAKKEEIKKVYVHEFLQAVAQSKIGRVCQLISSGVPVDSIDEPHIKNTALHWAASYGNEGVLKVLCEGGCDINAQNGRGDTPLHDAVRRGDLTIVKKLLIYGADPSIRNLAHENCHDIAKKPEIVQCLSLHNVAETLQRSNSSLSIESENSIISNNTNNSTTVTSSTLTLQKQQREALDRSHVLNYLNISPEHRHDLLWPRPQHFKINLDSSNGRFVLPDRKLRLFLMAGSELSGLAFETLWEQFRPWLADIHVSLEIEYETHKCKAERGSGLFCGVFSTLFHQENAYQLKVRTGGAELTARDELGLWYGVITLIQCLRIADAHDSSNLYIPQMMIKDWPDTKYRGVLVDFTGCRLFNVDTLCSLALDVARLKANQLIFHFETRVQDSFFLPYNQKELYRLKQFCEALRVELVPALDINGEEADVKIVCDILTKFCDRFSSCSTFFFGSNLSRWLLRNSECFSLFVPSRIRLAYISIKDLSDLNEIDRLPFQCVFSLFSSQLTTTQNAAEEALMNNFSNDLCLKFTNFDPGYLCCSPEEIFKHFSLASQLGERFQALSIIACDLVSGCEIVPRSFSFLPELATLGVAWNRRADLRRYFSMLPLLVSEHVSGERTIAPLFKEILAMGHLERELTKMMAASASSNNSFRRNRKLSSQNSTNLSTPSLSVFVQLLLNPDFIDLELLTPVAFKKVRLELQRSLHSLNELKHELPYNYELALSVAEVQLIAELMILASKIGQSLCLVGTNPRSDFGSHVINVGVSNLLLTSRTDLANKLLEIRTQFQHAWLSRNCPGTLSNALKIFDNLFKTLLPPAMQQYGEQFL